MHLRLSQKNKASDESWYELCRRCFTGISEKKNDGTLVYEKAQLLTVKENELPAEKELPRPVFSWISQAAPEEDALSRPYTPSRPDDDEQALASPLGENGNSRYRRGRLIHKLLQFCRTSVRRIRDRLSAIFWLKRLTV